MPLGKWTVPVTVPIGTWFFLPNGSHWKEATSFHLVATSCMVKLTSNFILSTSVVTGIFQPISTVVLSSVAEALGLRPSVPGVYAFGWSLPSLTSAIYQWLA